MKIRYKLQLTAGSGVISKALALHKQHDALSLHDDNSLFWIEDAESLAPNQVIASPRIGIDHAEECIDWPWRFHINGNRWVSKHKK